jgi:hypothetical protein
VLDLVPLLVPRFQKQPERYVGSLRELLRFAPPPKALLADLDSSDANHRRNALFALADDKEPIPTRYILQLATDRDPKMRAWSIGLGFEKRRSDYRTGNGEFFTLAMSADTVAHQKFGFDSGTERVPMQNERNEAALKRYANWVRLREH